jgi:CHASE1-domain containing sensor protein
MHDAKAAATLIDATGDQQVGLIEKLQMLPARYRWLRWAVLACSLAFGAGGTYLFYLQALREARSNFRAIAKGISHELDSRFRTYEDVLYALRGLFDSKEKVTQEEFHVFAEGLALVAHQAFAGKEAP